MDVEPGFFKGYDGQPSIPQATDSEVFDIDEVFNGTLSLTESINNFVIALYCHEV